ncbi:M91 family zinc metallopeptidase [Thermoflexibacter ruber]|uniref:RHS repeat-associated core domain-containing protein n=1 Tax=Thermoflexibacter ruber TaxID=1003 RepID=A0A1I2K324_9BACT|nr:M91 family zinc metallopeptidase [Thermoflexibacter ruber]SFF61502.1 RHS repeat-associated core domain-containing protein [Thermoflexibacter ruber]
MELYYPFGLGMKGLDYVQTTSKEDKRQFNGVERNTNMNLNIIETQFRIGDTQIGRWWQVDPKPNYSESVFAMMGNNPVRYADPKGDTLRVSFGTGFLGLGKKQEVIYNNGNLTNADGSVYTGKVKGFLKKVVNAVNAVRSTIDGRSVISTLEASNHNFTIMKSSKNPSGKGNEFVPNDSNKEFAVARTGANPSMRYPLGGTGGTIYWNTNGRSLPTVDGLNVARPITDLAHEIFHAYEANLGITSNDDVLSAGLSRMEYRAVYFENSVRRELGYSLRSHYSASLDAGTGALSGRGASTVDANGIPIYVPPTPIHPSVIHRDTSYLHVNLIY